MSPESETNESFSALVTFWNNTSVGPPVLNKLNVNNMGPEVFHVTCFIHMADSTLNPSHLNGALCATDGRIVGERHSNGEDTEGYPVPGELQDHHHGLIHS